MTSAAPHAYGAQPVRLDFVSKPEVSITTTRDGAKSALSGEKLKVAKVIGVIGEIETAVSHIDIRTNYTEVLFRAEANLKNLILGMRSLNGVKQEFIRALDGFYRAINSASFSPDSTEAGGMIQNLLALLSDIKASFSN